MVIKFLELKTKTFLVRIINGLCAVGFDLFCFVLKFFVLSSFLLASVIDT